MARGKLWFKTANFSHVFTACTYRRVVSLCERLVALDILLCGGVRKRTAKGQRVTLSFHTHGHKSRLPCKMAGISEVAGRAYILSTSGSFVGVESILGSHYNLHNHHDFQNHCSHRNQRSLCNHHNHRSQQNQDSRYNQTVFQPTGLRRIELMRRSKYRCTYRIHVIACLPL